MARTIPQGVGVLLEVVRGLVEALRKERGHGEIVCTTSNCLPETLYPLEGEGLELGEADGEWLVELYVRTVDHEGLEAVLERLFGVAHTHSVRGADPVNNWYLSDGYVRMRQHDGYIELGCRFNKVPCPF